MVVARQRELAFELGFVELLFGLELEGVARQKGGRRQPVQRGGGRDQHHIGGFGVLALADAPERGQPLGNQVLVWRKRVIRQGFPVREHHAAQAGGEKHHFIHQPLRIKGVCRHDGGELAGGLFTFGQLREQHGVGRADRAGQGEAFTGVQDRQVHGEGKTETPPASDGGGCEIHGPPYCRRPSPWPNGFDPNGSSSQGSAAGAASYNCSQ